MLSTEECKLTTSAVFPRFEYPDVNFWIWYVAIQFKSLLAHS